MPRARGDKEYRVPMLGLNTEASVIDFPEGFIADLNNIGLSFNPLSLKPRLGHTETSILPALTPTSSTELLDGPTSFSWFLWEKAGGNDDVNIVCVHIGGSIIFLDANVEDLDIALFGSVNLNLIRSETSKGSFVQATQALVQFTRAKDFLVITSEAIDPVLVRHNGITLEVKKLSIKVRDTIGLESGIAIDKRPTDITDFPVGSIASTTYTQLSEGHEYNLLNQGWYYQRRTEGSGKVTSDPIISYFESNSEHASNAEIVHVGMVADKGDLIFDADFLRDQTFGSTPSARGHYVVDAFDIDREVIRNNPQESGALTGGGGSNGGDGGAEWTTITLGALV